MIQESTEFLLTFVKKERIAKDTYSFYFLSNDKPDFLPGQYIRIRFTTPHGVLSRFFTIASSPLEDHLIITTKIPSQQSACKEILFNLAINAQVSCFGPIGGFVLREEDHFEHVFLAGGIGVTPFHSMITYAAKKKLQIPLMLIVSFSSPNEIIYFQELTTIAKQHSNIKIIYTVSNPDEYWKGETGRISEMLIKKYVADIYNPTYYIVGSLDMITDTEELLENMGVGLDKIKVEQFTGY